METYTPLAVLKTCIKFRFSSCYCNFQFRPPSQNAVSHGVDEVGVADAVPERLVLVGVGEGVGVGEALHDGDEDPETVGGRQHDQQLVEVPAMDHSYSTPRTYRVRQNFDYKVA